MVPWSFLHDFTEEMEICGISLKIWHIWAMGASSMWMWTGEILKPQHHGLKVAASLQHLTPLAVG